MGYFQVTPGQTVASSHMNTAIAQTVISFATVAARDAEIPAPVAGMVCYLQDSATLQQHNGFVWVGDTTSKIPTGVNGWNGANVRYIMNHRGVVFASGNFTAAGATNTIICTLPANYKAPTTGHNTQQYARSSGGYGSAAVFLSSTGTMEYVPTGIALASVTEVGFSTTWQANFSAVR